MEDLKVGIRAGLETPWSCRGSFKGLTRLSGVGRGSEGSPDQEFRRYIAEGI